MKTKLPELSEKQIQNTIIDMLNFHGFFAWTNNTGAMKQEYGGKTRLVRFGKAGASDIIGIRKKDGVMICLEVKRPSKRNNTTPQQDSFLQMIKDCNGIAGVVCSWEDVEKII